MEAVHKFESPWEKILQSGMRGGGGGKRKRKKKKVDDTGINTRSIIDDLVGRRGRAEWRPGISFTISQRSSRKDISGPCYSSPPPERGNNRGRNGSSNFVPTEREHRKTPRGQSRVQDLSDCTILKIYTFNKHANRVRHELYR